MKTVEPQQQVDYGVTRSEQPFFGTEPEQAFFARKRSRPEPFFKPAARSGTPIQTKLTVGAAGDRYEQEADRVASQVVDRINRPSVQPTDANQSVQRMNHAGKNLQMKGLPDSIQQIEGEGKPQMQSIAATIQRLGKQDEELQRVAAVEPQAIVEPPSKLPTGVLQRTVLLTAGMNDIDPSDLVVYNMIDYALNKVGGPVVSAWDQPSLSNLKETEELFIVEHGKPGRFDNPKKNQLQPTMVDKVIEVLTDSEKGLPAGFQGTIHVTSCWAGVGVDRTPSVVTRIKDALTQANRTGITVLGAKGPTTGYHADLNPRVIAPDHAAAAQLPPHNIGRMPQLRGDMEDWLKENQGVDIPTAAAHARELVASYVPQYVKWLEKNKYLLDADKGFVKETT